MAVARLAIVLFVGLATAGTAFAAEEHPVAPNFWNSPPQTFQSAFVQSAAFGLLGIVMALLGFKLFDWMTPGDLQKEVVENKNIAAAIVTAAIILGICFILSATVH